MVTEYSIEFLDLCSCLFCLTHIFLVYWIIFYNKFWGSINENENNLYLFVTIVHFVYIVLLPSMENVLTVEGGHPNRCVILKMIHGTDVLMTISYLRFFCNDLISMFAREENIWHWKNFFFSWIDFLSIFQTYPQNKFRIKRKNSFSVPHAILIKLW